jgi:hypothetical protein
MTRTTIVKIFLLYSNNKLVCTEDFFTENRDKQTIRYHEMIFHEQFWAHLVHNNEDGTSLIGREDFETGENSGPRGPYSDGQVSKEAPLDDNDMEETPEGGLGEKNDDAVSLEFVYAFLRILMDPRRYFPQKAKI